MTNIKKYTEVAAQIELLRKRGMVVDDGEAEHWLSHVNYYRLSGYWFAYRREADAGQPLDEFDEGTSFHDVDPPVRVRSKVAQSSCSTHSRPVRGCAAPGASRIT